MNKIIRISIPVCVAVLGLVGLLGSQSVTQASNSTLLALPYILINFPLDPPGFSNEWTHQGFDQSRRSYNPTEWKLGPDNLSSLVGLWINSTSCTINFSPTVANGIVYYGNYCGEFWAVDAETGGTVWTQNVLYAEQGHAVVDGMVYVAATCTYDNCGKVFAFDANTGAELWSWDAVNLDIGGMLVANGIVYFNKTDQISFWDIQALDAASGVELWSGIPGGDLAYANGILYANSSGPTRLIAYDAENGNLLWNAPIPGSGISMPVVAEPFVYVHSDDGYVYAFDSSGCGSDSCSPLWTAAAPGVSQDGPHAPSVGEGKLFLGAGSTFYAFDALGCGAYECAPLWTTDTSCTFFPGPRTPASIANGVVYSPCDNNYLYAFEAATGEILWQYFTSGGYPMRTSPVIVDGRLFHVATFNFHIYAFEAPFPSGVSFIPKTLSGFAAPGEAATYEISLLNHTGNSDSFLLELGGNQWPATLSITNTGQLADGEWISFTAFITVPEGADWYAADQVVITATSVNQPLIFTDMATIRTVAYQLHHPLIVNTLEDELNADGDCSLREAITAANENIAVDACLAGDSVLTDTITFGVAGTITVTSQLSVTAGGPLVIDGGDAITVSGNHHVSLLSVGEAADLSLERISLSDGWAAFGGGVLNSGRLIVRNSIFSDNTADAWCGVVPGEGGGIANLGILTIENTLFHANISVCGDGGAVINWGIMTVTHSTFHNNVAGYSGGAINNWGTLTVTNSTLSGNSASNGGALHNFSSIYGPGTLVLINSTLSGNNVSFDGGGIYNNGILSAMNNTLISNTAGVSGGGIYNGSVLTMTNSIVALNASDDCFGAITSLGHNLAGDNSCNLSAPGDMNNTNPSIGPLQDNGGPTWTHALLEGSPAIDAGDNIACPPTDQRGVPRPLDGNEDGEAICDIGSYEYSVHLIVTTLEDEFNSDGDCSLREAITAANDNTSVDACLAGDAVITDTITFSVQGMITVTSQLSVTAGGPLVIDGGEAITVSGGGTTRVWWVETGSVFTLQHLTVANGFTTDGGAGLYNTAGNVYIVQCKFLGNRFNSGKGGGIYSQNGTLTVLDSHLGVNGSDGNFSLGGGIAIEGGMAVINQTSFRDNQVRGIHSFEDWYPGGGGLYVGESTTVSIHASSFLTNTGIYGAGGILNLGTLLVSNSTFSGNSTSMGGGGITNGGTLTVTNGTLSGNYAYGGGGIAGSALLINTILAGNGGGDCSTAINDGGHNLDSDGTCGLDPANGSMPNTDPLLGPLQDNGGPTWTHALLVGSPAIDAGDNIACPLTDQRGFYRPIDGNGDGTADCDMGAYEYGSTGPWGIHLFPPYPHIDGTPGATVTYIIYVYNGTDITDTYTLATGLHAWETTLSTDTIGALVPFSSQAFTLTVVIPQEASWYETDTVVVTATSVTSPTEYTASAQVTTQAYAPPQISVSPASLSSTQYANEVTTQTLTIHNGVGVTLTFDMSSLELFDDFSQDSGMWTYLQSAYRDVNNEYVVLTEPGVGGGVIWLENSVSMPFSAEFRYRAGNGSSGGADGMVFMFYKDQEYEPSGGWCLGFGELPECTEPGYGIEFDGWWNAPDPYEQHIAIIKDNPLNHLQLILSEKVGDYLWHLVRVEVAPALIEVFLDGELILHWEGELDRSYTSMGFSGSIGAQWSWHQVDDFHLMVNEGHAEWVSVEPLSGTVPANNSVPIQVTFDATGLQPDTYTTTLYVSSNDPLIPVVIVPVTMTVTAPVTPTAVTISGLEAGWVNESQAFTALVEPISTTLPVTYTWQATGQAPITHTGGITDTVAFTWQYPGSQFITVTATNDFGSVMGTHIITITDVPIEGLSASNDSPTLCGNPTNLTATVAAGTNVTFTWDFGDETSTSGAVVTHTYPAVGVYTATVTAANSVNGLTATTQVTVAAPSYPSYLPLVVREQAVGGQEPSRAGSTRPYSRLAAASLLVGAGAWLSRKRKS